MVNALYIEIKQKCWKFIPQEKKVTKYALFRFSRAPTHHSFTFDSWFLYELEHKVHLSKTVYGILHFRFCLAFVKIYIFLQQNALTLPNGHTTSNPRYVDDQFSTNFRVIFRVLFRCNFDGRKLYVVSTHSFQCYFAGRKIHVVSTYLFWWNFDDRKIHVVSTYFFRCNFDGRKIHVVFTYSF